RARDVVCADALRLAWPGRGQGDVRQRGGTLAQQGRDPGLRAADGVHLDGRLAGGRCDRRAAVILVRGDVVAAGTDRVVARDLHACDVLPDVSLDLRAHLRLARAATLRSLQLRHSKQQLFHALRAEVDLRARVVAIAFETNDHALAEARVMHRLAD